MANRKIYWLIIVSILFTATFSFGQNKQCLVNALTVSQSAYLDDHSYLEYSIPDMETLSHIRYTANYDSSYSFNIGLGYLVFDLGFTMHLFTIGNKPFVTRFNIGSSIVGDYFQNIIAIGLADNKHYQSNINISFSYQWLGWGRLSSCIANTENFQISETYYHIYKITENFNIGFSAGITQRFIRDSFERSRKYYNLLNFNLSISYKLK
ncbi:MAG: hypothetical protein D8M58_14055 [Calditrichaeota bacterium]|nr:MAG: hypothetical protein DWQ03_15295 [Calditrichota bacterium]MBL1206523.1 hypothetical protein [Calditrichota bacterium]NOG46350.1 hypothetical protein [Calditrichota bacterium]